MFFFFTDMPGVSHLHFRDFFTCQSFVKDDAGCSNSKKCGKCEKEDKINVSVVSSTICSGSFGRSAYYTCNLMYT